MQVFVSHSQIAVFHASLTAPFSLWTGTHVNQGFAWRPGSVSFRTLEEGGLHDIDLAVAGSPGTLADDVARAIEVPFDVPPGDGIEVGSISETFNVDVPPGRYCLRFVCLRGLPGKLPTIGLTFQPDSDASFAVLRADGELRVPAQLLTTAEAAV
ncbi:MAG: competence protein ComJ [Rhodopila sp.]